MKTCVLVSQKELNVIKDTCTNKKITIKGELPFMAEYGVAQWDGTSVNVVQFGNEDQNATFVSGSQFLNDLAI
jgi:hypothetical protein